MVEQLQLAGDDVVASLERWLERQRALRDDRQEAQATAARLEQVLGEQTVAELEEAVATAHAQLGPRPEVPATDIEGMAEQWGRRREAAAARVSELSGQIENLSSSLPLVAAAIEAEAEAERQLEAVQSLGRLLDVVQQGMEVAKEQVNADIAPALAAKVRPWLPRITDGRYVDVEVDPSTLEVKVLDLHGGYREATVLSHGTTEQIYLLLRLALAELLANEEETAPLILDDVTVQSDQARTRAFLDLLRELSADRQIVVFTQEDEVVDWGRGNFGHRDRLHELSVM